jgi:hypothetical protein
MADDSASNLSSATCTGIIPICSLFSDNKENNFTLQTAMNTAASSQSRKIDGHHDEMSITRKVKTQVHVKKPLNSPSTAGSKPCSTSPHCNTSNYAATATGDREQLTIASTKVPVDPPGATLGALPFMQYLNGQQHLVASHAEHVSTSNGGGMNHPIFHPLFPSITNWGYHHNSHLFQGHLTQQQHGIMNNDSHNPSQQWVMPYFLAPFASTVSPLTSNHKTDALVPSNSLSSGSAANSSYNSSVDQNTSIENFVQNGRTSLADGDETTSTDESMASTKEDVSEDKEVEMQFIPTTFAPTECIEKIRARQKAAAAKHNDMQPRQTRSMSRRHRRDCNRSKSSKATPMSADTVSAFAHQACSPRTNSTQVKGGGSKVAAVNGAINQKNPSTPQVMTVLGKRVIMVDPVRKVFIIELLSPEVCDEIRMMADNHTREVHKSGLNTETWRTLYTYTKMDLPVAEVKDMTKKYTEQILLDVKKIVGEIFGGNMRKEAMNLRPRCEAVTTCHVNKCSFVQSLNLRFSRRREPFAGHGKSLTFCFIKNSVSTQTLKLLFFVNSDK